MRSPSLLALASFMQILVDLVMNERSVRRPHALDPGHDLPIRAVATLDNNNGPVARIAQCRLPHRRLHLPAVCDQNAIVWSRRQAGRNERNSPPTTTSAMVKDYMSEISGDAPHELGFMEPRVSHEPPA